MGFDMLTSTLRDMGFITTDEKNVPPTQRGTFLGGGLDSNTGGTGMCSKYIDDERKEYVAKCCLEL